MPVDLEQLKKIRYLRPDLSGERALPLQPYFDGREWELWLLTADGTLTRVHCPGFVEGRYFAAQPAASSDGIFEILNFLTKHAYYDEVAPVAHAIEHDLLNLAAELWKLDLLFEIRRTHGVKTDRTIVPTIEFVLVTCRSLLDLVQLAMRRLWRRVKLHSIPNERHHLDLPSSLADVVLISGVVGSVEQIKGKYHLPDPIASFYARSGPFVSRLRGARDAVVHHPTQSPFVFAVDRGFAVPVGQKPFAELAAWDPGQLEANRLGSLRHFLASVVRQTIAVAEDFAETFRTNLELPEDIAPGLAVFLRSAHTDVFHRLDRIIASNWDTFAEITIRCPSQPDRAS